LCSRLFRETRGELEMTENMGMLEELEAKDRMQRVHNNAAALIIAAAEKSGLLRDVANALHYSSSSDNPVCLACGVFEELTEQFGEYCTLPGYDFYGEGFCISEYSDEELRPYLYVPFALPS
jgi:hypothetical protein